MVDKQAARFGLAKVWIRSDVGVIDLDIALLLQEVNQREHQVVDRDLGNVVVFVDIVVLLALTASAATMTPPPSETVPVDPAVLVIEATVAIVRVKAVRLEGVVQAERPL